MLPRPAATALTITRFDEALAHDVVACDLRRLSFIDAYGLVATACALRTAAGENPRLRVRLPGNATTAQHLATMGLTQFAAALGLVEAPTVGSSDHLDVVVPLRSAHDAGGAQALSALLWEQLNERVDPLVLEAVAEGVWEMVANALEHSGTDALIMGQVYRRARGGVPPDHDDRVQVVIGDVGRGIRNSFLATGTHLPNDDGEAIRLALQYLVTSVPNDRGRGQGLTTTMEQILALGGRMYVRSGAALVSIDGTGIHEQAVETLPGVIVALSLPLYPGSS